MQNGPVKTGRFYACGLAIVTALGALVANASPAIDQASAAPLIQKLGDASQTVRDEAYATLFGAGRSARSALLAHTDDVSPVRRKLVRQLLRELPLFDANEPAALRKWLTRFEAADANDRPALVLQMVRTPEGLPAATRVVFEASDEEGVWSILSALSAEDRVRIAEQGRAEGYEPASAPQWFLAGDVATDAAERLAAFQKALDKTRALPPEAIGAISRVANTLCAAARARGDVETELAIRRSVALLLPGAADAFSLPASSYLEARLQLRASAGLEDDLLTLDLSAMPAEVAFVKAILSASPTPMTTVPTPLRDVPPPIIAAADGLKPQQLIQMLEMLRRAGDIGLADALAGRLASQLRGADESAVKLLLTRTLALRYGLAVDAKADPKAALQTFVQQLPDEIYDPNILDDPEDQSSYSWFTRWQMQAVRRAVEVDDRAVVNRLLDQLVYVPISNSTVAIDAIYVFEMFGRPEAADEVYLEYASMLRAQLDDAPRDYTRYNSVAWFSARTGRDLQEAYRLARQANSLEPRSPAIMDTLAEAAFRIGKVDEAVAAERRALAAMPHDPFMTSQLQRFNAGLGPDDAEKPLFSEDWAKPIIP